MKILPVVLLVALTAGSSFAQEQPPQQRPQQQPPRERNKFILELEQQIAGKDTLPAEQVFKNIQVLKGGQAQRVLRIMEFGWSSALGVECNHCHVEGKWESDEKEAKGTARKMSTMVSDVTKMVKAITDEHASVTCYTCHRGDVKPARGPRRAGQQGPRPEPRGDAQKQQ